MSRAIKVVEIGSERYRVLAEASDRKGRVECSLLTFLNEYYEKKQYRGSAAGMFKLIEMFAEGGGSALTTEQSHYVDKDNKIYQLKKGDLRVLYFYANEKDIVICSHGFLKTTRKAEKKEVDKAIRLQSSYLESGRLDYLDLDDD